MRTRIFKDPKIKAEMIALLHRQATPNFCLIAKRYGCDHSSVIYWARKEGIAARWHRPSIRVFRIIPEEGEHINPGKNYREYLETERARKDPLHLLLR